MEIEVLVTTVESLLRLISGGNVVVVFAARRRTFKSFDIGVYPLNVAAQLGGIIASSER